jgi:hypothetical protein
MIVSSPFSTVGTLPETGASRNAAPVAATAAPTRRAVSGAIEERRTYGEDELADDEPDP